LYLEFSSHEATEHTLAEHARGSVLRPLLDAKQFNRSTDHIKICK